MKSLIFIFIIACQSGLLAQSNSDTLRIKFPIIIDLNENKDSWEIKSLPEHDAFYLYKNYNYLHLIDTTLTGHFKIELIYQYSMAGERIKYEVYLFDGLSIYIDKGQFKYLYNIINRKYFNNILNIYYKPLFSMPDTKNQLIFGFDEDNGYISIFDLTKYHD